LDNLASVPDDVLCEWSRRDDVFGGPRLVPHTSSDVDDLPRSVTAACRIALGIFYGAFPIGLVRLDDISWRKSGAYLRYIIAVPDQRSQGLGTDAVIAATCWAHTELGLATLRARVHQDNLASQRVLAKAGFAPVKRRAGHYVIPQDRGQWSRDRELLRRDSLMPQAKDQLIYEHNAP